MKMRYVVAVSSAALVSFGALAGGEQQSSAGTGTRSATVQQAQGRLLSEGFDPGAVDGTLGQQTQQGLLDFQQSRGLEPTGQLDRQTIAALGLDSDAAGAEASSPSQASPGVTPPAPQRAADPESRSY